MIKVTEVLNEFLRLELGIAFARANPANLDDAEIVLRSRFPQYLTYRGGNHVALCVDGGQRLALVIEA